MGGHQGVYPPGSAKLSHRTNSLAKGDNSQDLEGTLARCAQSTQQQLGPAGLPRWAAWVAFQWLKCTCDIKEFAVHILGGLPQHKCLTQ